MAANHQDNYDQFPFIFTISYATFLTQEKQMLFRKPCSLQDAVVEGKACSVLSTAIFGAQITAAMTVGSISSLAGSNIYIMFLCCVPSALAFFMGVFTNMPVIAKRK